MSRSEDGASALRNNPGVPLFVAGFAVLGVGVTHYWLGPRTDFELAMLLLTIPLMASYHYTGYHLQNAKLSVRSVLYLLFTAFTFWLFGGSIAAVFVGIHYLSSVPIQDGLYLIFLVGTTTSAIGPPISYYYLRATSQRAEISALNQRLSVINRVLRHNIRNELTVLRGTFRQIDPDADSEAIDQIDACIERLLHLSDHAKILRDVWMADETTTIDVPQTIERVVTQIQADHPAVALETDLSPAGRVEAHPKLEVALDEVITNAIIHNDPSEVTITVRVTHVPENSAVRVSVVDTGRGMPQGEIQWIGQRQETALEHSEGLGLWLTYWIIEKSDGDLQIESECNEGTHVTFELPAAD